MESYPQPVGINMQPYGKNGAGTPAPAYGPPGTAGERPEPGPRDFVLWSLFNTLFCNPFCLGFIALVFSVKARDRKIAQDPAGAGSYGRKAKQVNIVAFCLGAVVTIICLVFLVQSYKMMLEAMKHH
ncbi:interferon-induced transmembrane protein 1-like [Columba livia]|uniref:interferon-induced transmembrane protein 1-like n=1 Tax=Columba livia TaxID=8932 RepID=UPI0028C046E8|nr:hypothetical protein Q9966_013431 [Columba livia]KAK2525283.1 hypothetical protein Q9233_008994 [Columba guinea]